MCVFDHQRSAKMYLHSIFFPRKLKVVLIVVKKKAMATLSIPIFNYNRLWKKKTDLRAICRFLLYSNISEEEEIKTN